MLEDAPDDLWILGQRKVVKHYSEISPDRLHSDGELVRASSKSNRDQPYHVPHIHRRSPAYARLNVPMRPILHSRSEAPYRELSGSSLRIKSRSSKGL